MRGARKKCNFPKNCMELHVQCSISHYNYSATSQWREEVELRLHRKITAAVAMAAANRAPPTTVPTIMAVSVDEPRLEEDVAVEESEEVVVAVADAEGEDEDCREVEAREAEVEVELAA